MNGIGRNLKEAKLKSIIADFEKIRIDHFYQHLEKTQAKGRILPFVRGLRLSALLIYEIRSVLVNSGLTASWGHILNDDETLCTVECDIVIHRGDCVAQWNGSKNPIMDFSFIENESAIAVISCKSFLETAKIEKEYPGSLEGYVDKVWLFAECCRPGAVDNIRERCNESGYGNFWYFYTWDKTKKIIGEPNIENWLNFLDEIKALIPPN
ncbi:MAG: hypothetical protein HQ541_20960 [Mariniphaga sp.]|nr:hypothetical protein [Mariniphaga sp.]